MNTELIIFHRPNSGGISQAIDMGTVSSGWLSRGGAFSGTLNSNTVIRPSNLNPVYSDVESQRIDLYDEIDIPITYNLADISDPDKRKTAWSKTVRLPGTKNNNQIFQHIYQISGDGWTKIGNTQVYTNFNPNIRKEVIINSDGVQILKGNLQLKGIRKNNNGDIEYDIAITGDFSSLFFDIGTAKLNDLDFSEWDHSWSKTNITNSWDGILKKNGLTYSNVTTGAAKIIGKVFMDVRPATAALKRMGIETTTAHGYVVGDFVKAQLTGWDYFLPTNGTWCVAEVISTTRFTLNTPFPVSLMSAWGYNASTYEVDTLAYNPPYGVGNCYKVSHNGTGYVYPLVSWGDEYDMNSFPVTSMAPSYFMKEILDKIFAKTNSKYSSTFLNSEMFKRLIVTQKKTNYELTAAQVQERTFWAGSNKEFTANVSNLINQWAYMPMTTTSSGTNSFNQTAAGSVTTHVTMPFYLDGGLASSTQSVYFGDGLGATGLGPGGNWDTDLSVWNVTKSGEYDLDCSINLETWVDIRGDGYMTDGTQSLPTPVGDGSQDGNVVYYAKQQWTQVGGPDSSPTPYLYATINLRRQKTYQTAAQATEETIGSYTFVMDGQAYSDTNANWAYWGRYQPNIWKNKIVTGHKKAYFSQGEKVWLELKYYTKCKSSGFSGGSSAMYYTTSDYDYFNQTMVVNSVPLETNWYLRLKGRAPSLASGAQGSMNMIFNTPSPKSTENSDIYGREFLPKDMTCQDFLKNIIKMFNLYIEPDRNVEKLYYIEPRDDYYQDGSNGITDYVDWTDKMDADSVEITPMGLLLGKTYTFKNKEETDYWNKRFKDERGRNMFEYNKEISNDFLKNQVKVEVSFGQTVMINSPEKSDVVIPAVLQKEATGAYKPVANSAPRVLIWSGLRPWAKAKGAGIVPNENGYTGWELLSSLSVNNNINAGTASILYRYPYAGTVDSPQDPMYDINWFNMEEGDFVYYDYANWSNHNLYNAYWKGFIDEVSDPASMVVTAKFNLLAKDVAEVDFRKIYVIDNVYYRLQKIVDFNPVKDQLTKVELLKLKAVSRFTRQTISYNGGAFETIVDTTRPLHTTYQYAGPRTLKDTSGDWTNTLPSGLGNGTIAVNGLSNVVGDGRHISIHGAENQIGHGGRHIAIQGTGIVVGAGHSNVNVIGSSNLTIEESDVTYINNIRYKNGVPISRCNVIDAGMQSGTVSLVSGINRNTTMTVIDAAEDIVSRSGSSTYETVINAGQDSILPNLVELGLSTRTNPNPKTNYSGGADNYSATASMVDIVRANRQRFLGTLGGE